MIIYEGPRDYEFAVIPHAKRLVEALETLGMKIREFSIQGRILTLNGYFVLHLQGELIIERAGLMFKTLPQVLVELIEDMEENIKKELKPLGMFVYLRPSDIKITYEEKPKANESLVIDCPEEIKKECERFGKGVLIDLRDKGIAIDTLVISSYVVGRTLKVRVTVVPNGETEGIEEVVKKKIAYLERTIKGYNISLEKVEVITPKIKPVLGFVLIRKRSIEREADEIVQNEEVKSVLAKIREPSENHRK
ncbi:hypothetical protein A3L04_07785 [Thermococcus chitonophagus]|uniref:Uncharacterized protein n=2 Tax=Thermococcus chitonophagus TaxID=54262 RepID=A0A160VTM0_9EURY|nr:hypothetical protein A3L04_07785 [Thermococcus chitonophagus]CUX78465.1 hypothetical protein CHITON_1686 [Thermococcus chitonophagus]